MTSLKSSCRSRNPLHAWPGSGQVPQAPSTVSRMTPTLADRHRASNALSWHPERLNLSLISLPSGQRGRLNTPGHTGSGPAHVDAVLRPRRVEHRHIGEPGLGEHLAGQLGTPHGAKPCAAI